jgi:SAM-dependent methyltransferase
MEFLCFRDVKTRIQSYFAALDLRGQTVVDIPAGQGRMTGFLRERGAEVLALDLFTHGRRIGDVRIEKADLTKTIPLPDGVADYVLCQEGIEHLPDPSACLRELSRILKPDGRVLVTTPNVSNLRSRFYSYFLESNSPRHLPANEVDDVAYSEDGGICFEHVFLIGVQKLRILGRLAGLRIRMIHRTELSGTSLLLFLPSYPLIWALHLLASRRSRSRRPKPPATGMNSKEEVLRDVRATGLNPIVLITNHLFLEFEKCPVVHHRFLDPPPSIQGTSIQGN